MGSYIIRSALLLNDGTLYKAELWDKDYRGDVWKKEIICKNMPSFDFPLFVQSKDTEGVIKIIEGTSYFKEAVQGLCEKGILNYCSIEEAADILFSNIVERIAFMKEKGIGETSDIRRLCNILGIDTYTHKEYFLNGMIIDLICPKYILFKNKDKYYPLFLDEIEDATLSFDGTVTIARNKEILQGAVRKGQEYHQIQIFLM